MFYCCNIGLCYTTMLTSAIILNFFIAAESPYRLTSITYFLSDVKFGGAYSDFFVDSVKRAERRVVVFVIALETSVTRILLKN